MTPEVLISYATVIASVILSAAFLLTVYRVLIGPTLPDRVVALDMLVGIAIGFIGVIAIRTSFNLYVDIALALGLVGFLATVAFSRFILSRQNDALHKNGKNIEGVEANLAQKSNKNARSGAAAKRTAPARKKRG